VAGRARRRGEVRAPARAHALDRGDDPLPDHERAQVGPVVGQRLLQVVDGPLDLQRPEHPLRDVRVLDARHPEAHRAEERLDDHVGAELAKASSASPARSHAIVRGVGRPRPRAAPRPGTCRPSARSPRPVDHPDARGGQRVEDVDAEDDLLEGAARDAAHEHHVARVERELAAVQRDAALDPGDQPRHGREAAGMPARDQRALEPLRVPAPGGPQDRDPHAHGCPHSTGPPPLHLFSLLRARMVAWRRSRARRPPSVLGACTSAACARETPHRPVRRRRSVPARQPAWVGCQSHDVSLKLARGLSGRTRLRC
jgi:hypothetical protein